MSQAQHNNRVGLRWARRTAEDGNGGARRTFLRLTTQSMSFERRKPRPSTSASAVTCLPWLLGAGAGGSGSAPPVDGGPTAAAAPANGGPAAAVSRSTESVSPTIMVLGERENNEEEVSARGGRRAGPSPPGPRSNRRAWRYAQAHNPGTGAYQAAKVCRGAGEGGRCFVGALKPEET